MTAPIDVIPLPERLWNVRDLARFCGVSPRTIERWEIEGAAPPRCRIGTRVRYDPRAVARWIAERGGSRVA